VKDLDYYSDNAVYLDNVASRNGGTIEAMKPDTRGKDKTDDDDSVIVPYLNATTGKTLDGGYVSIGAINSDWFKMWQTALSQAKVLIQIQTPEYFTSDACAREMEKIREKLKGSKLELLAITVSHTLPRMVIGQPRTTPMQLGKIPGTNDLLSPVQHLKGSWVINNSDFEKGEQLRESQRLPRRGLN
jgi:hypothetical protein